MHALGLSISSIELQEHGFEVKLCSKQLKVALAHASGARTVYMNDEFRKYLRIGESTCMFFLINAVSSCVFELMPNRYKHDSLHVLHPTVKRQHQTTFVGGNPGELLYV